MELEEDLAQSSEGTTFDVSVQLRKVGLYVGAVADPDIRLGGIYMFSSILFLLLEIFFYPGGSQAHRGTLLLYPGLGQAQILHVDSTCKNCGGVMFSSISRLFVLWSGPKSVAKLDGGRHRPGPDFPSGSALTYTGYIKRFILNEHKL